MDTHWVDLTDKLLSMISGPAGDQGKVYVNAGEVVIGSAKLASGTCPAVETKAMLPEYVAKENLVAIGEGLGLMLRELYEYLDHLESYDDDFTMRNGLLADFLVNKWGRAE